MASITLRKGDPFEAILTEMVEMHRAKGHDYNPDPDNTKGLLPTNFDEVAREVPLVDYTPVMDAYTMTMRKLKRVGHLLTPGFEPVNEALDDSMLDAAVYAVLMLELHRRPEDERIVALRALGVEV